MTLKESKAHSYLHLVKFCVSPKNGFKHMQTRIKIGFCGVAKSHRMAQTPNMLKLHQNEGGEERWEWKREAVWCVIRCYQGNLLARCLQYVIIIIWYEYVWYIAIIAMTIETQYTHTHTHTAAHVYGEWTMTMAILGAHK